MHILQIANDFNGSKVHANLFQELSKMGIEQTVYCPIRNVEQKRDCVFVAKDMNVIFDYAIKPYHRYAYHIKRWEVFSSLQKKVNLKGVDIVHASNLFSDGGLAYKIYQKYQIPYVLAVRSTDINVFLALLPNTWQAGRKILRNARKIFFISKALLNKFSTHKVIKPILSELNEKIVLMPNGIDDYYLDHVSHAPHDGHKVLYVGDFSSNKNVLRLGEAVLQLKEERKFEDITLTLVGGGKNNTNEVQNMIDSYPNVFNYLGTIYDKEVLCEIFNDHSVFAMPSIKETFGLVYLEALTQNLPVIYSKGQGIDNLFDNTIGLGVNPFSVLEIKMAIKNLFENPNGYSNRIVDFELFRWSRIAEKYMYFYKEII